MPALSFMKQFCPRVESGGKRHSLRAKRRRPWKVGDDVALYYAMRTKSCRLLGRTKVVKVDEVLLLHDPMFRIRINGELLAQDEAMEFARRDGFHDLAAMRDFWMERHAIHIHGFWQGDLIHWKFPFEDANGGN